MATTIDELEARLDLANATFTSAEVMQLIERHEHDAATRALASNSASTMAQLASDLLADNTTRWAELQAAVSYQPPIIQMIGGANEPD